jgi:hypothetical protein
VRAAGRTEKNVVRWCVFNAGVLRFSGEAPLPAAANPNGYAAREAGRDPLRLLGDGRTSAANSRRPQMTERYAGSWALARAIVDEDGPSRLPCTGSATLRLNGAAITYDEDSSDPSVRRRSLFPYTRAPRTGRLAQRIHARAGLDFGDRPVGFGSPVAIELPGVADVGDHRAVHLADHDFILVAASDRDELPTRID